MYLRAALVSLFLLLFSCKQRDAQINSQENESSLEADEEVLLLLSEEQAKIKIVNDPIPFLQSEGDCSAEEKAVERCLKINEPGNPYPIEITYQFYDSFLPERESILFINGGPGGNHRDYIGLGLFKKLSKKYNILFFDQRGSGTSSPLTSKQNLIRFTISHHLADIDVLRREVLKSEQIIIMGHSFGAHLALAYASKFPTNTKMLVAMNGSSDAAGFVTQSTLRRQIYDRISERTIGKELSEKFETLGSKGKLKNRDGEAISSLFSELHPLLYTFEGQTILLPKELNEYKEFYLESLKSTKLNSLKLAPDPIAKPSGEHLTLAETDLQFPSPRVFLHKSAAGSLARGLQLAEETKKKEGNDGLNEISNQWTVCFQLLTPQSIKEAPATYRLAPLVRRKNRCKDFPLMVSPFDYKKTIAKITAPTLLTGGTNDPLVPFSIQRRDFARIAAHNKNVSLIVIPNTGHNPDENPACFENIVLRFLNNELDKTGEQKCSTD